MLKSPTAQRPAGCRIRTDGRRSEVFTDLSLAQARRVDDNLLSTPERYLLHFE